MDCNAGSPMTIGSGGSSRGSFSPPGTAASGMFYVINVCIFYLFAILKCYIFSKQTESTIKSHVKSVARFFQLYGYLCKL